MNHYVGIDLLMIVDQNQNNPSSSMMKVQKRYKYILGDILSLSTKICLQYQAIDLWLTLNRDHYMHAISDEPSIVSANLPSLFLGQDEESTIDQESWQFENCLVSLYELIESWL